jgi:NADH-quinone oxidoreductase subunit G
MFGSICKDRLSNDKGIPRENIVVVSVMPCTAKKFEARRDEFKVNGNPDVDHVITTKELILMIKESGLEYENLELSSFELPFGFASGAGVIFGSSGGVSEAVLRFAADTLESNPSREFKEFRGKDGIKIDEVDIGGNKLRLAVVSGLANARALIKKIKSGEEKFDLIEVMACNAGCVNGGGQPVMSTHNVSSERAQGLYDNDRMKQIHVSSDNPYLQKIYQGGYDEHKSHELLHTTFVNRKG